MAFLSFIRTFRSTDQVGIGSVLAPEGEELDTHRQLTWRVSLTNRSQDIAVGKNGNAKMKEDWGNKRGFQTMAKSDDIAGVRVDRPWRVGGGGVRGSDRSKVPDQKMPKSNGIAKVRGDGCGGG